MIDHVISAKRLLSALRHSKLPRPFQNMLCVLYAEGARRRYQEDVMNEMMLGCTNPVYKDLYDRWLLRCGAKEDSVKSVATA